MGSPLTGASPYADRVGLIKTSDKGALSTTLKQIGDGAGNDSPLYLATNKIGFNEAVNMTKTSTEINNTVAKVAYISVTQNVDLDAIETNSNASKVKTDLITVTGAVDLDTISSTYLSTSAAASTYLTQANAASTYLTQANAASTYLSISGAPAAVRAVTLSGLSITGGAITSSDTILAAFGKLQNQVNAVLGGAAYQGTWNASTNSPSLSSGTGTQGYYYVVSVAGSTNLDGITDWKVGDWAIFNGTTWDKVDNTDAVSSVDGMIGAVDLSATYQPISSNLTTYAGIAPSANVQTLLGAANYSAFRTSLGVAIGSDVQAYNATLAAVAGGTYTGASSITTLGTIATGTWNATSIGPTKGGTGISTYTTGDILYASATNTLSKLAAGTNAYVLTMSGGVPTWAAASGGGGGSGDMVAATYDPANIAEQLVGLTATQTLSNKTLTAPKIVNGGYIADANGNEILEFETTASAVNHLKIVNDITNGDPYIEVVGNDTNVGMYMVMKGSGFFALDSTVATTGSSRGPYAVDLQLQRNSASQIASGNGSFVVGYQNTCSGSYSSAFGNNNISSGQSSFALGNSVTASGQETFAGGFRTRATMRGQFAWSGGMHTTGGNTGDNQFSMLVARRYITGATTGQTGITLYIGDGTSTEIIPDVTSLTYRTWTVEIRWNVVISATSGTTTGLAASDTVGAVDTIVLKKTGSTVTVIESTLGTIIGSTNLKTGLSMGYTASGTNFRINLVAPTFAGGGSLTLKTNAVLHITENGY